MAKNEDVILALELFHKHRPTHALEELHTSEMGLLAVVRYLKQAGDAGAPRVTSKELSDALGVSSARMTVLLKKLEQKGLICKAPSPSDARAVEITLSSKGEAIAEQMKTRMYETAARVVDEFGIDELQRLMESVQRIKTILHESRPNQLEDEHV